MGFDLSTAKPINENDFYVTPGGFDLSTAKKVEDTSTAKPSNISKLESAGRSGLQGVTLNFADELSGLSRAIFEGISPSDPNQSRLAAMKEGYTSSRDERRLENEAAQKANPLTYAGGEIAGSILPSLLTGGASTPLAIAKTAAVGGASGFGGAEGDLSNQGLQALKGTFAGAAIPIAGAAVKSAGTGIRDLTTKGKIPFADTANAVRDFMPGSAARTATAAAKTAEQKAAEAAALRTANAEAWNAVKSQGAPRTPAAMEDILNVAKSGEATAAAGTAAKTAEEAAAAAQVAKFKGRLPTEFSQPVTDAIVGGVGAYATGENPLIGAAFGAAGGEWARRKGFNSAKLYGGTANIAGKVVGNTIDNAATKAATQALVNMSGEDARSIKQKYDPKIQAAVEKGQPVYAATFQALSSSPEYRAASAKADEDEDKDQIPYGRNDEKEEETE